MPGEVEIKLEELGSMYCREIVMPWDPDNLRIPFFYTEIKYLEYSFRNLGSPCGNFVYNNRGYYFKLLHDAQWYGRSQQWVGFFKGTDWCHSISNLSNTNSDMLMT